MKYYIILIAIMLCSCKKFLDEKPNQRLAVPSTLKDYQAMLDVSFRMNTSDPFLGEASADNYFLKTGDWQGMPAWDRNIYIWEKEIDSRHPNDWSTTYDMVYYANLALEGVQEIERTALNEAQWNNVKGSALLYRARAFLAAAWIWSKSFDSTTAGVEWGVPLRKTSNFLQPSVRATVAQTYEQVIADLEESIPLLPAALVHPMRPSKPAAWALLARTFLSARNYSKALVCADSALRWAPNLLDYNTLNPSLNFPFQRFNPEVIMHTTALTLHANTDPAYHRIDTVLYNSYTANDLRRSLFFFRNSDGYYAFKGSYDNSAVPFTGTTVAEMYLIRAECYARQGNITAALTDLNTLSMKRYKTGTFIPLTATSYSDALDKVLAERRKELIFRDLRWMDIKRLNREGRSIVLARLIKSQGHTLPPNNNRYALPIPEDIIAFTGMPQNPR